MVFSIVNEKTRMIKANGDQVPFGSQKVRDTCVRAGASRKMTREWQKE